MASRVVEREKMLKAGLWSVTSSSLETWEREKSNVKKKKKEKEK